MDLFVKIINDSKVFTIFEAPSDMPLQPYLGSTYQISNPSSGFDIW